MGYAAFVLPGETEPRGYAIATTCAEDGCDEQIDKGYACLCYGCARYFCERHLYCTEHEFESGYAGHRGQACKACWDAHPDPDEEEG